MAIRRIQHRRGTSVEWSSVNPLLYEGEIGYETDTGKSKIGDGSSSWNDLNYCILPLDLTPNPAALGGNVLTGNILTGDGWTLGAGWAADGTGITKTAGSATAISQTVTVPAGAYVVSLTHTFSAGTFTTALGASSVLGSTYSTIEVSMYVAVGGSLLVSLTSDTALAGKLTGLTVKPVVISAMGFIGGSSIEARTPTDTSLAVGRGSQQYALPSSTYNTTVGSSTGSRITTGASNTLLGSSSGSSLTIGQSNTAVGDQVMSSASTVIHNVSIGSQSMYALTGGYSNAAVGSRSLYACTSGAQNVSIGTASLRSNTVGSNNVCVGLNAGYAPSNNVANATITGGNNVFVGAITGSYSAFQSNQCTAVGYSTTCGGNYSTAIGQGASARFSGSVAIGVDGSGVSAVTTTTNEIVIGTSSHLTRATSLRADTSFGLGVSPKTVQTVTGSRGGNAALASLLTALASFGLIVDSTTA